VVNETSTNPAINGLKFGTTSRLRSVTPAGLLVSGASDNINVRGETIALADAKQGF
jgi:hypothetical protein